MSVSGERRLYDLGNRPFHRVLRQAQLSPHFLLPAFVSGRLPLSVRSTTTATSNFE